MHTLDNLYNYKHISAFMSLYIELMPCVTHEAYMHDNILEFVHKFCKTSITSIGSSNYLILGRK